MEDDRSRQPTPRHESDSPLSPSRVPEMPEIREPSAGHDVGPQPSPGSGRIPHSLFPTVIVHTPSCPTPRPTNLGLPTLPEVLSPTRMLQWQGKFSAASVLYQFKAILEEGERRALNGASPDARDTRSQEYFESVVNFIQHMKNELWQKYPWVAPSAPPLPSSSPSHTTASQPPSQTRAPIATVESPLWTPTPDDAVKVLSVHSPSAKEAAVPASLARQHSWPAKLLPKEVQQCIDELCARLMSLNFSCTTCVCDSPQIDSWPTGWSTSSSSSVPTLVAVAALVGDVSSVDAPTPSRSSITVNIWSPSVTPSSVTPPSAIVEDAGAQGSGGEDDPSDDSPATKRKRDGQ